MGSLLQGLPRSSPECIDGKVVRKIQQWSLPGAEVAPVLNVSSRVFWLEQDDKALLDSYTVLQEGILCDVFSQKCSAAWQGARGQRLTVAINAAAVRMLMTGLTSCCLRRIYGPPLQHGGLAQRRFPTRPFAKSGAGCRPSISGMEVKLRWQVLADRMYTKTPTGKSREELYALLFDKAKNPYEEKACRGSALKAVQTGWEQCQKWMLYFKGHSAPCVMDLHGLLQAFRCKEEALVQRLKHLWNIVQRGGDSCQM